MKKLVLLTVLALTPAAALAEGADIETLVVVANRRPETLDRIGNSVTVLNAAEIAETQAVAVSDLLARVPGITVARNGGIGQTTSVYLRGAEAAQTTVLIDGVKLNDPSSPQSGFDFGNLLVGEIDRIEVLRGPQSTLWGSQAIGGVVNIVPTRPASEFEFDATAEGGSFDTGLARAGFGGTQGALQWRLGGGYFSTGGIPAFDEAFGGHRPTGARQGAASGQIDYAITPEIRFDLRAYYTDGRNNFDGFDTPTGRFGDDLEYATTRQLVLYAGLDASTFRGRLANRIDVQRTEIDRKNFDPALPTPVTFDGIGGITRVEYQGNFEISPGSHLVFGAEDEVSTIRAASPAFDAPGTPPTRGRDERDSGYAQIESEVLKGLTLMGGARHDSDQRFGGHDTGQAALAWTLTEDTILRASWGQGFKAPSLYELFSDFGNTGLKPESANAFDGGIEQYFLDRSAHLRATYFQRTTDNLIQFLFCNDNGPVCRGRFGYYANVARAFAQGEEIEAGLKPSEIWDVSGNYTHSEAFDRSRGARTFGKLLPRRPVDTGTLTVALHWPHDLSTDFVAHVSGSSFDDSRNRVRLGGYALFDMRGVYRLSDSLELYARIENLFDRHYETIYQYGAPGRAGYAGIRVKL